MSESSEKRLVLGTALWGWSVGRSTAFALLDHFVAGGGCYVDTATNYPINGVPSDFGKATGWLREWLRSNGLNSLRIILKTGAVDNSGKPESQLSAKYLRWTHEHFSSEFEEALDTISTHWDNREDAPAERGAVAEIVDEFRRLAEKGLSIGLSGIKNPELYHRLAPDLSEKWWIQVKENVLTDTARRLYELHFENARFLAYGLNLGGIRPLAEPQGVSATIRNIGYSTEVIRFIEKAAEKTALEYPAIRDIYDFSLYHASRNPRLAGIIVGPSDIGQMARILDCWRMINCILC
jgi:aryl-alcohol dehydrogenase-like predicted oxidoreductase